MADWYVRRVPRWSYLSLCSLLSLAETGLFTAGYPPMIQLSVLGSLDLRGPDGHEIRSILVQPKRLALLVYLVIATPPCFHRRDKLCALFWPEIDAAHARNALSQALHVLRRGLGRGVLVSRGNEEVGIAPGALICDALAFSAAIDDGRPREALELYRGDLLEGFFVSETAPEFERWLSDERARLKVGAMRACGGLAAEAEERGDPDLALLWVRRAGSLAPHDEEVVRRELAILDRQGEPARALQVFEEFSRRLASDLELDPSVELQTLVDQIRSRPPLVPAAPALPHAMASPRSAAGRAPTPPRQRRPVRIAAALAATLVIAGGGAWWWMPGEAALVTKPSTSLTVGARPYLAVLPFVNLSPDAEQKFFSDGLAEELITRLGQVPGLLVAPRTSSFALEGQGLPVDSLVRSLGVTHFMTGAVRREGDRVRITARLIDAAGGFQQWSHTYDRKLSGVIAIQDEIARAITQSLRLELTPGAATLVSDSTDTHAYDLYLHGLAELEDRDMNKAIALFEEAVERDPALARAHASLAYAYAVRPFYDRSVKPIDSRNAGWRAVERALALDSNLADAHMVSGILRIHFDWDFVEGERDLRRAVELNPSLSDAYRWLAQLFAYTGRDEEAVAAIYRAAELDPFSTRIVCNIPRILAHVRRPQEAIHEISRELCQANSWWVAYIHVISGDYVVAESLFRSLSGPGIGTGMGRAAERPRQAALAAAILRDRLEGVRPGTEQILLEERAGNGNVFSFAEFYAVAGDAENATRVLEQLYVERHPHVLWITSPEFDEIRSDPRYRKLVAGVGLPINQ